MEPNLAVVSTPSHYLVSPAKILIANNIPVLLEKPVSHNWEGIDQLIESAKKSESFIMVAYILGFHPGIQQLMDAIKEKKWGKYILRN